MNTELIPQQELEKYQGYLGTAERFGMSLEIKTDADYQAALVEGKTIKDQYEIIIGRKEQITKPLNATLKSVRDLFRPLEASMEVTLGVIKAKMLGYTAEKERKVAEAAAKIDARVERGTLSEAQASVKKFVAQVPKTVSTSSGSATTKKVRKYYVTDMSLVPVEFTIPDMVKIKASFVSGFPVPGCEERIESSLSFN